MFKSISKRNLWMIAQNTTLSLALLLGFSQGAKAEDEKIQETVQISCNPFTSRNIQCDSESIIDSEGKQIAQRRGRKRKSKVDGYYGGFALGIGFGSGEIDLGEIDDLDFSDPEYSTSFMASLYEGIKFNKNLAADLEFLLVFGGVDGDSFENSFNEFAALSGVPGSVDIESDYSTFALYLNPRFELPLAKNNKFNLYVSPGIGLSQTNVSFRINSDFEGVEFDETTDASDTGITFQIKGGASLALSDTIGVVAQVRYLSLPTDDGFDSISLFGADAGLKFNF